MSDTDTVSTEAMPLADTAGGGGTMVDLANLWPIGLALLILFVAFGALMWKRPEKFTTIRINLLWLSTLVAILTLVFGHQLIKLLGDNSSGDTKTVEIVLSSLVGVGIGGLIAIAGQLVQDSGNSTDTGPSDHDQKNDDTSG